MPSDWPVLFANVIGSSPFLAFLFLFFFFFIFFDPSERRSEVYNKSGVSLEQVKDKVVLSLAFP